MAAQIFITDKELARWKPAPDLVKGLLQSGEVNMLFAPKNRGKTFLGLDLAYSIATEQPEFLGRRILKYGSVVYLCAEGRGGLVKRREAWRVARGYREDVPKLAFWREQLNLADEDLVSALIELIKEHYPDCVLVIIDTLSQHMPGGDEGTAAMSTALDACQRIRNELKTTVLAIHHPTKRDEGNERGGSGFRGGCADVLNVDEKDGVFWLTTLNARERGTDEPPIPYVLDIITLERLRDEEGFPLTSCAVKHLSDPDHIADVKNKNKQLDQQVLNEVRAKPGTCEDIRRRLHKRKTDVDQCLKRLEKCTLVEKDSRGHWSALAQTTQAKGIWAKKEVSPERTH